MLRGVRIVDLTRVLAGPVCTMTLGDVIKIERPGDGDESRTWGPPFDDRGESAYYLSVNRNKLSIAADLDRPDDRATIIRLIRDADAVVDNFRPGSLERHGIAIHHLLEECPKLVWCTLTGFGARSPRPGYDFVLQAECGWMAITGEPEGEPMKVGVALVDILAGKDAAIAILAALAARAEPRSADERRLFISLAASATAALVNVAQNTLISGREARRWGNAHANLVPYQLFQAADRPIVIAVGSDDQWRACARALELLDLAQDPSAANNAGRLANRDFIVAEIAARVATRPAAHWIERLRSAGVPTGIVRSVREALVDVDASPLTGIPPAVPGSVRLPPPRLDEHGALLRQYGWQAFEHLPPR
jgi:crotonobetainyl-CoA:carnitine CoA-transferase CaiB-like acyl-CoA transferase